MSAKLQLQRREVEKSNKEDREKTQEELKDSLEMFKKELAEARELLAKKDEELRMRDLKFRKQERDTKSSLRSLKMKLLDAEVHEEEEKHKLEVAYKKELQNQKLELEDKLDHIELEKNAAEANLSKMKQTAATQKQVLDKQFLVASKNEQGRENELYDSGRRLSMSDEDYNKLQDELHKIRIENAKLLGTNEALEKHARDDQKTQTEMLKRIENGQAELQRSVHHNTRQIEEVKDGVDETKLLVHQHMALLEGTHESVRNNMRRITNMLDTEVAVPNLIVVVPAPEKARRTGWTTPNLSSLFELSKLLQQKSMDLHIICPLTRKIAVRFEVSKPAAFTKENAGLIKLGNFALKAGNVALKIASKLGTGLDLSLDTSEIDTFIEGVDKLNEEFADVSGVDVKETATERIIAETVAMREYFEGERGDVHLEQEKSREMKKMTGKSYENLKSFLDQRNRMSEVRNTRR